MNLSDKVKNLPSSPGVYLMKDSYGSIIYVGKSKNLKKRVQSYFQPSSNHSPKTEKLVSHLKDFDYIMTDTEFEAFLLECKLIKERKPLYNKLMKRYESYTYVVIKMDHGHHRLGTAASINENDGSLYFGPFSNRNRVETALQGLKRFFKIDCNARSGNTPCLNYSLGLCTGMCFQSEGLEEYHRIIKRIIALFQGKDTSILNEMEKEMGMAATQYNFEKATALRDALQSTNSLIRKEKVVQFTKNNRNIIIMETIGPHTIKLFLVKRNDILLSKMLEVNLENLDETIKGILEDTLHSFREVSLLPAEVGKEEIDQSQIIYSYLKKNTCSYSFIPKSWIKSGNSDKLRATIKELLEKEILTS